MMNAKNITADNWMNGRMGQSAVNHHRPFPRWSVCGPRLRCVQETALAPGAAWRRRRDREPAIGACVTPAARAGEYNQADSLNRFNPGSTGLTIQKKIKI